MHDTPGKFLPLASAPPDFFMTLRDIAFWIRSARADSRLQRLRHARGAAAAHNIAINSVSTIVCCRCCRGNRIGTFSISAAVLGL